MRIEAKTLAAALCATALSTGAFAQSVNSDTSAGAGAGVGADVGVQTGQTEMNANSGMSTSTDANGNAGGNSDMAKQNYGQIIANLKSGATADMDADTAFADVTDDTEVNTVLLSELKGNAAENASALDEALSQQEDHIADIRSAIDANTSLSTKLSDEGYSSGDVVAVETGASGEVTLIIDDRS